MKKFETNNSTTAFYFSAAELHLWAEQNQKFSASCSHLICKLDMDVHIHGQPGKTPDSASSLIALLILEPDFKIKAFAGLWLDPDVNLLKVCCCLHSMGSLCLHCHHHQLEKFCCACLDASVAWWSFVLLSVNVYKSSLKLINFCLEQDVCHPIIISSWRLCAKKSSYLSADWSAAEGFYSVALIVQRGKLVCGCEKK